MRAIFAAVFVFLTLASGHLFMVVINKIDANINDDLYRSSPGVEARWLGDRSMEEEWDVLQARNQDIELPKLSAEPLRMLPTTPFLGWVTVAMGALGFLLLLATRFSSQDAVQSMLGIFGALFLWTGPVEYGLMLASRSLGIAKSLQFVGGQVVGAYGEYVLLKYTWGLLAIIMVYLLFLESNRGPMFMWLRRTFGLMRGSTANGRVDNYGPRTAFQYILMMWWFYVVLLWSWDPQFAGGVGGWLDHAVFASSWAVSGWLLLRLVRKRAMGPALRYAIAAVIIFWNTIEILAKWGVFNEPWLLLRPATAIVFFGGTAVGIWLFLRELNRSPALSLQ
jgi:hypothetical protein